MKQNRIAVTGGIGSGKSTVCKILKEKGYVVFSCDDVYADILSSGKMTEELVKEFGADILDDCGMLDRKKLSKIVFADDKKREQLNNITHSKIFKEMFSRAEAHSGTVFFEVPLLFEGHYQKLFDNVIVVLRNKEKRVESIKERDNLSEKEILERIKSQYNYDNGDFAQYYVIHNDVNYDKLCDMIDSLLLRITKF